jgi:FkbM family methyltransferase
MFSLLELLPPPPPKIRIVDVGAQMDSQQTDVYEPLVRAGCASIVGFEPLKAECDRLNACAGMGRTYLPYAVGEGDLRQFRVCANSMTSSLYEPNMPLLAHFHLLEDACRVVDREDMRTTRLDEVPEIEDVDFLKLDVQGAEADVLRGAARTLSRAVVVHAEVEFLPLYKDQPLFGDIDALLRAHGFLFHTFTGFASRAFRPVVINNNPNLGLRQQLWSEAVFVKSFLDFRSVPPEKLLRLAVILHDVYSSYDLCALALQHCDTRLGAAYIERLTGATAPAGVSG